MAAPRLSFFYLGALSLGGAAIVYFLSSHHSASTTTTDAAFVSVAPRFLFAGRVSNQDRLQHGLELACRGRSPVKIQSVITSCSCSSISPTSFWLQPGKPVEVGLTASMGNYKRAPSGGMPFSIDLEFLDSSNRSQLFTVNGEVYSPIVLRDDIEATVFRLRPGENPDEIHWSIECAREVDEVVGELPEHNGDELTISKSSDPAGTTREVSLRLAPRHRLGTFIVPVNLNALSGNRRLSSLPVNVFAVVEGDVACWPESLTISVDSETTTPQAAQFVVYSVEGQQLIMIDEIYLESSSLDATFQLTTSDEHQVTIDVGVKPTVESGLHTATIRILGTHGVENKPFEIGIPLVAQLLPARTTVLPVPETGVGIDAR